MNLRCVSGEYRERLRRDYGGVPEGWRAQVLAALEVGNLMHTRRAIRSRFGMVGLGWGRCPKRREFGLLCKNLWLRDLLLVQESFSTNPGTRRI